MNITVLHAGGLGDLVLVETLVAALRERHPGAAVTLLCRADVAPAAALYAHPPDQVRSFDFNPYHWALPAQAAGAIAPFIAELSRDPVDVFVAAELKCTWLGEVLASALRPRVAIVAGANARAPSDLLILLRTLGLHWNAAADRPQPRPAEHELDRYARLAGSKRRLPSLRHIVPERAAEAGPIVVFPAGSPDLKRWSRASFRDAIERVATPRTARVILVGSEAERPELESLASGDEATSTLLEVVTAMASELPRIATLIAGARGYLGIDTGLGHLAAAYGVPGVTVYGGGTWPAYAPWSRSSAAVVAPIPCFGCHWDCSFERAFCIERIGADAVVAAFDRALGPDPGGPVVDALKAYDDEERTIFAAAASVHATAQLDRAARLRAIIRLHDILDRYRLRALNRQARASAALSEITKRVAITAKRLHVPAKGR